MVVRSWPSTKSAAMTDAAIQWVTGSRNPLVAVATFAARVLAITTALLAALHGTHTTTDILLAAAEDFASHLEDNGACSSQRGG